MTWPASVGSSAQLLQLLKAQLWGGGLLCLQPLASCPAYTMQLNSMLQGSSGKCLQGSGQTALMQMPHLPKQHNHWQADPMQAVACGV